VSTVVMTVPDEGAPLGAGPVATVYSGLYGGVPVALKVFPARFDRATLAAAERDRVRLREIPAVLSVDGVEQLPDGRHAVRMERCAQSLAELLAGGGRLDPANAVELGYAVATALAAAHTAGVVHGGVQPANVLFRTSGQPVLADFGVALRQAFPRDTARELEFLAPETLRDETRDERTDLYGLGALLHLALTGRPPLPGQLGEPAGERVLRLLRTPVPAIHQDGVPVILSTVVGRLLAPDPAHRPPDAAWVAEVFAEMLPRPDTTAEPDGAFDDFPEPGVDRSGPRPDAAPAAPPARRPRRLRRTVVVGGVAAVCVFGAGAALLLGGGDDDLTTTPRTPPPATQPAAGPAVTLDLAEPADGGNQVTLSWTSSSDTVDYAVIVAPEGEPNRTLLAQRLHTMTVPVDPLRRYCFEVQATDGRSVYTSPSQSIRGAVCHR
jgi:hypothetical protein